MKLLSVERSVAIFDKKTEKLLKEYPVELELSILKEIVKQGKNDELLYSPYKLNKHQVEKLFKKIGINMLIETKSYYYSLECYGNYQ
jgi:hypothetical protein